MNNERRNKGGTASLPFILTKAWLLPSSFHDCEKFREVSELKDNMEGKRLTLTISHGLQTAWLLCPWDFLGKNTGVGCHFLFQRSSQPRDRTCISSSSCIAGGFFTDVPPGKPPEMLGILSWKAGQFQGLTERKSGGEIKLMASSHSFISQLGRKQGSRYR